MYRYYLTQRPPMPGASPRHPGMIMADYGYKKCVYSGIKAWGHADYPQKLSDRDITDYELVYGGQLDGE